MKLIFIHGRSQQGLDPVELQKEWVDSLDKGLQKGGYKLPANLEIVFPYFGDRLDYIVEQLNTPLITNVIPKGNQIDTDELDFMGRLLAEMTQGAGISNADIQANLDPAPTELGVQNWNWVRALLRTVDQKTSWGEAWLDTFTRDVYVYLKFPAVRKEINQIVAKALNSDPCVVVGHSLGSVVGFNVLREAAGDLQVKRYITVGSPLGMNSIKQQLDMPLAMPKGVPGWYNAFDPRDVVALLPLDRNHFNIKPRIVNKANVDNFTPNRHGISGYLSDPDVATQIAKALGGGL